MIESKQNKTKQTRLKEVKVKGREEGGAINTIDFLHKK
jgi:hypothetical protein